MKIFIYFFTISLTFAQDPTLLEKGQVSPYTGILITKEKARKCLEYKLNANDCERINKDLIYNNEVINKILLKKEEEHVAEKKKKEFYKTILTVALGFLVGETLFMVSK